MGAAPKPYHRLLTTLLLLLRQHIVTGHLQPNPLSGNAISTAPHVCYMRATLPPVVYNIVNHKPYYVCGPRRLHEGVCHWELTTNCTCRLLSPVSPAGQDMVLP